MAVVAATRKESRTIRRALPRQVRCTGQLYFVEDELIMTLTYEPAQHLMVRDTACHEDQARIRRDPRGIVPIVRSTCRSEYVLQPKLDLTRIHPRAVDDAKSRRPQLRSRLTPDRVVGEIENLDP